MKKVHELPMSIINFHPAFKEYMVQYHMVTRLSSSNRAYYTVFEAIHITLYGNIDAEPYSKFLGYKDLFKSLKEDLELLMLEHSLGVVP